jgi:tRNA dimethylallyltransferase
MASKSCHNNYHDRPPVIVLCGPTGVGKTAWALELAETFGGRIIGADSMQIYKYMDIGTAKPSLEERARIPHYLIDVAEPDEEFSAGKYARMAESVLSRLHENGILPFLVGGTGLYIKACLNGLFREGPADNRLLAELKEEAEDKGAAFMHEKLKDCDPASARRINPNDVFRIIRALEVYAVSGCPASEHIREHGFSEKQYATLKICLNLDREALYRRIDARVDAMLETGFAGEVAGLLESGYPADLKSMQSIGYRHMAQYLRGEWTWAEMRDTMMRDTRRYAKRQLTWFRGDTEMIWVDKQDGIEKTFNLVDKFITQT